MRLFALALVLISTCSQAALVNVRFGGTITEVSDPQDDLAIAIAAGHSFEYELTYDDSIAEGGSLNPDPAVGHYSDAPKAVRLWVNGELLFDSPTTIDQAYIEILDDYYYGQFADVWLALLGGWIDEYGFDRFHTYVWLGTEGSAVPVNLITSLALSSQPPVLGNGNFVTARIRNAEIVGNVTQLLSAPVPIPASVWLLGSALGVLGWVRRKSI